MAKRYKRRWLMVLMIVFTIFMGIGVALYYLVQSQGFLDFVVRQLNKGISGDISYKAFDLDLDRRHLTIRELVYKNEEGETSVSLESLDLDFDFGRALRGNIAIKNLLTDGLIIDRRSARKVRTPTSWRTALRFIFQRLSIQESQIRDIHLFLPNGDEFVFQSARVVLTPQVAEKQELSVWVEASSLKPADVEIKTGRLFFNGQIKIPLFQNFDFFVSEAKGGISFEDVEVGKLPPSTFRSEFEIGGDTLYLSNGRFIHPDGMLSVDVDYIPKKSTYKVDLKTMQPFPFHAIPRASERLLKTFDRFEFSFRGEMQGFALEKMSGKVELFVKTLGNLANPETPENEMNLKGQMKNGNLQIGTLRVTSAKTDLSATGSVDFSKLKIDTRINAKGFDLTTLMHAITDVDLTGYVDAEGTIQGSLKSPQFNFNGRAYESGYSFLHFGPNQGIFKIEDGNLSYQGGAAPGSDFVGNVQLRTENIYTKNKRTTLRTQFENIDVSLLVDNPDIKGKVSGTFDLDDTSATTPTGTLKAKIPDFWVHQFHIGEMEAQGSLGNRKFVLNPVTFQPPKFEKLTLPQEAVFEFDDRGVKLKAEVLPGASVTGNYLKSNPNRFNLDVTLNNVDIRPVLAALELSTWEGTADGKIRMALGLNKTASEVDITLTRLTLPLEEGEIRSAEPIEIRIRPPRVQIVRGRFQAGQETFALQGSWTLDGGFDLDLKGKLDLQLLSLFPQIFREGSGFADVNVRLRGTRQNPQADGEIIFSDATLRVRALRGTIEELTGKLALRQNRLHFENLKGILSEGDIILNGHIDVEGMSAKYYDLKIETREAAISEPGVYKVVFNGNFTLKGPAENIVLAGKAYLTEGKYSRNFSITQFLLRPEPKLPEEPNPFLKNLHLDLEINSTGDLAIKNNVAQMFLQANVKVTGPALTPKIGGTLAILEGKFHYFQIDFENARGVIDFREPGRYYVDITASKEFTQRFGTVTVTAQITGFTDNLQINFTSDSGLERRDLMALVYTGALPGQGAGFTSSQLASTVLASQLTSLLSGAFGSSTLDIVRLEATEREAKRFSTLVVGKQLTPRLSLEFKTDLGVDEPLQGIQMEYLLIDNVLVKGSQLSDGSFDLDFALRWKSF